MRRKRSQRNCVNSQVIAQLWVDQSCLWIWPLKRLKMRQAAVSRFQFCFLFHYLMARIPIVYENCMTRI